MKINSECDLSWVGAVSAATVLDTTVKSLPVGAVPSSITLGFY